MPPPHPLLVAASRFSAVPGHAEFVIQAIWHLGNEPNHGDLVYSGIKKGYSSGNLSLHIGPSYYRPER